jgi:MFS family permease
MNLDLAEKRERPNYKWLVVCMLWFVCFFNYADRQAIFSIFPLIKQQFHLTDVQLGVLGAAFMWMYALFGPVAGWLCDRFPRKGLIIAALFFWSIVTAATSFTHTYTELLVCRALGGLGEAFYFPAAMSLLSDYHGIGTRSKAMSLHQSGVYAGSIAGGALSGLVGEYYGWRPPFILFGVAGIVLGVFLIGLLKEPARGMSTANDPEPSGKLIDTDKARKYSGSLWSGLSDVLQNRMAMLFLTWLPTFLYEKFHMSLSMAGFSGTAYLQVASVVGVLSGGVLADFAAKRVRGGRLFTQAAGLIGGVPFLFLTGWSHAVPAFILATIGFGYFKGLYDANIFAGLYDVVPVERRGVAAGVLNSLGWMGAGFAPIAIALGTARYGMSLCISATGAIYLTIGLLLAWGGRRINRHAVSTES